MNMEERANLISALAQDLKETVAIYHEAAKDGRRHVLDTMVGKQNTKTPILRKIVELRTQLSNLYKEFEE